MEVLLTVLVLLLGVLLVHLLGVRATASVPIRNFVAGLLLDSLFVEILLLRLVSLLGLAVDMGVSKKSASWTSKFAMKVLQET